MASCVGCGEKRAPRELSIVDGLDGAIYYVCSYACETRVVRDIDHDERDRDRRDARRAGAVIDRLLSVECDSGEPDVRRWCRDARLLIMTRQQRQDHVGLAAAVREADYLLATTI